MALAGSRPDLLLFQAGADPLRDDPYSPLDLDHGTSSLRDKNVFAFREVAGNTDRLGACRRLRPQT